MPTFKHELGLSLSGGGYRASAFHLGTLKKLEEMNILSNVDVLSTISGGSITGAAWCLHQGDYNSFHEEIKQKLHTKSVIGNILRSKSILAPMILTSLLLVGSFILTFTCWGPLSYLILGCLIYTFKNWQFRIFPIGKMIERAYDKFFFDGKTLSDLKHRPIIAIGSSNLETGRPFTFSKTRMSDSYYAYPPNNAEPIRFIADKFPISRAVMASSAVPGPFTPVFIDQQFYQNTDDFKRVKPQLVDGGVYDNQGIQKITQKNSDYNCRIIITSDAGNNFFADKKYPNSISVLLRTVNLFMNRIKNYQMVQNLYQNTETASRPIAYFSLFWKIEKLIPNFISNMIRGQITKEVLEAHLFDPAWILKPKDFCNDIQMHLEKNTNYIEIKKRDLTEEQLSMACNSGTNLTRLSAKRIEYLIRQAANLTELQVKLYCPMLVK